jgi:opacity protein-like surface antigen
LLGFGVEYACLPNWSAKIEYNYIDFGTSTVGFPVTTTPAVAGLPTVSAQIKDTMQIVKAGVNYHLVHCPDPTEETPRIGQPTQDPITGIPNP